MKNYKNIDALYKAVTKNNGQLTLETLINKQACLKNGWESFKIDDEVFKEEILKIVEVLRGWEKHKYAIGYALMYQNLSHWSFRRFIYNGKDWRYCAGQDYPGELKEIRKFLRDA